MKSRPWAEGYRALWLRLNGRRRWRLVHQLVAEAFLPRRPTPDHELRHLNGDPADNRAENLAWGTKKQNAEDRERHGRTSRGPRHALAVRRCA